MPQHGYRAAVQRLGGLVVVVALLPGCSSRLAESTPPTVEPAGAAVSPPPATAPAGRVIALPGRTRAALYDPATQSLVVLQGDRLTLIRAGRLSSVTRVSSVTLPAPAAGITGDGDGTVFAATRGGFFVVGLTSATVSRTELAGEQDTEFTAVARRADGRLVLGSAAGTAYTLDKEMSVSRKTDTFARVDAVVAVGDTAVVLDRAQTSVTALNARGETQQALRAGLGATSIAADPAGRVLVTDTRGGQLLVFSTDPLIARQAYPVSGAPYGVAGSPGWVWVSQTATNTVIGYDLATGIPVEKVRYPSVQQPNSLVFDDATQTLYVVSGSGAGVQVISDATGPR